MYRMIPMSGKARNEVGISFLSTILSQQTQVKSHSCTV